MIFVDTGFFYALASKADPDHQRVAEVFRRYQGQDLPHQFLTSNHVVGETITLAQVKRGHAAAVLLGEQLYAEGLARIHWATPEEEKAAFAYLRQHQDKKYSFVDCLSFVLMNSHGIREALALDKHFTHSFMAVPGPRSEI